MQSIGVWGLREETRESWDYVVSDEVVYGAKAIEVDLEIAHSVSSVNWLAKYDSGDIYLELKIFFFRQRDTYYHRVLENVVISPSLRDPECSDRKLDVTQCNGAMLVDVAELIQLPKGMVLERRSTVVRLKRFDNSEGILRNVSDPFVVPLVPNAGELRFNREGRIPPRSVGAQEGELPCEIVKAGTKRIGEFSNEHSDGVGSVFCATATWCRN